MKRNLKKIGTVSLLLLLLLTVPAQAVIDKVMDITDVIHFSSLTVTNVADQTSQTVEQPDTTINDNYTVGNTRVFANVDLDSNTQYHCNLESYIQDDSEFYDYDYYQIIVNMWLYVPKNDSDEFCFSQSPGLNSRIICQYEGVDPVSSSSLATVATEQYRDGLLEYIHYTYKITLDEIPYKLNFIFDFDTGDITGINEQVITFFGTFQFNNLENPQISDLENQIQGDGSVTQPPYLGEIYDKEQAIDQFLEDNTGSIVNVDFLDPFIVALNDISGGFVFFGAVMDNIFNIRPVYIICFVVLTFSVIVVLLRFR